MFDEMVMRKFRVLMADTEALLELAKKNPNTLSMTAYVLEADLPTDYQDNTIFVGATQVPTLLEAFGAPANGPVGFAFLVKDGLATVKRYFISLSANIPWGLPKEIEPVPLGVTSISGVLYGHFELRAGEGVMEQFIEVMKKTAAQAGLHIDIIKAKDYTAENMKDLLSTLAKNMRNHGPR